MEISTTRDLSADDDGDDDDDDEHNNTIMEISTTRKLSAVFCCVEACWFGQPFSSQFRRALISNVPNSLRQRMAACFARRKREQKNNNWTAASPRFPSTEATAGTGHRIANMLLNVHRNPEAY